MSRNNREGPRPRTCPCCNQAWPSLDPRTEPNQSVEPPEVGSYEPAQRLIDGVPVDLWWWLFEHASYDAESPDRE